MKEANIFEAWANRLVEGTWATPDTPEKQAQLVELMSKDLPVGADATNATEQLYDLMGDDQLFDQLSALAERDANADARQVILDRMQELSEDPDVLKVINSLNIDATAEMNPPEAINPADLEPVNESRLMDSAGETIEHVLNRFKHEVKQFEQTGELDQDLYEALFDYYSDAGEIPYGIAKARTGDPMEWVANNLQSHLSGGGIVGGNPDEDYGIEREGVMHGDYAEEKGRMQELAGLAPLAARVIGSSAATALGNKIGQAMSNDDEDDLLKDAANPGVTPADLDGVSAEPATPTNRASLISGGQDNDLEFNEGSKCNMTEAGMSCPMHGMMECGIEESALQGQYGHSGRMKEVGKDVSFLDRLKELSGMKK
jgi:hypothetical protein